MSETRQNKLRYLYLAELIVFALPSIAILAQFLVFLAFFAYGGLFYVLYSLLIEHDASHLGLGLFLVGLVTAALVSLWQLAALSLNYVTGRSIRTRKGRRRFWIGLVLGIGPLLFTIIVALADTTKEGSNGLEALYMSGLPLLVPVVHLAYATKPERKPPAPTDT